MNYSQVYVKEGEDSGLKTFFSYVYQHVALGLLLCGAVSFFVSTSTVLMQLIFRTPLFFIVLFSPLALSIYMGYNLQRITVARAQTLYWIYASLIGMSLSSVLMIYTFSSVTSAFLIAGGVFGVSSVFGRTTYLDLSHFRSILFVGLIGVIIASLVNIFMQSTMFQMMISTLSVVVFTGLIAYENQALKNLYHMHLDEDTTKKVAIFGALMLFISFVNLFIALLQLMGVRRE